MMKRGNGMIPEGVNEDGEEDEEDLDFPGDDDEPKVPLKPVLSLSCIHDLTVYRYHTLCCCCAIT